MSGWRAGLSMGVIVALGIAVWAAVSTGESPAVETSTSTTTSTTTSSSSTTTTSATTSLPETTSTVDAEARLEEIGLIVHDLWFRWLSAIYHEDHEALFEIVATEAFLRDFDRAVDSLSFSREPQEADLAVEIHEILLDTPDCLVVYRTISANGLLLDGRPSVRVDVLWPHGQSWRLATGWGHPDDLWMSDCTGIREELP